MLTWGSPRVSTSAASYRRSEKNVEHNRGDEGEGEGGNKRVRVHCVPSGRTVKPTVCRYSSAVQDNQNVPQNYHYDMYLTDTQCMICI